MFRRSSVLAVVSLVIAIAVLGLSLGRCHPRLQGGNRGAQSTLREAPSPATRANAGVRDIAKPASVASGPLVREGAEPFGERVSKNETGRVLVRVRHALSGPGVPAATVYSATKAQFEAAVRAGRLGELESLATAADRVLAIGVQTLTDAAGECTIQLQIPNVLHLYCEVGGASAHRALEINTSGDVSPVSLDLQQGNSVQVRVADPTGHGMAGIPVGLIVESRNESGHAQWIHVPWGATDIDGFAARRAARQEVDDAIGRLGGTDARAYVAPLLAGADRREAVPAQFDSRRLDVVMPRPRSVDLVVTSARGTPLAWPSATIWLCDPEGMIRCASVIKAGALTVPVLAGRVVQWKVKVMHREIGHGQFVSNGLEAVRLPLAGLCAARGRITSVIDATRIDVDIVSPWRSRSRVAVELDSTGRFLFPMLSNECESVTFRLKDQSQVVSVPQPDFGLLDFGQITLSSMPATTRAARIAVRDETGSSIPDATLTIERAHGAVPPATVEAIDDGLYQLSFRGSERVATVVVGSADRSPERHMVRVGEDKTITILMPAKFVVDFSGGTSEEENLIAVSLVARVGAPLVTPTIWGVLNPAASRNPGVSRAAASSFVFRGVRPGQYEVTVWSIMPPCKLATKTVQIQSGDGGVSLNRQWRTVLINFDDIPAKGLFLGLSMAEADREWRAARVVRSKQALVLPSESQSISYVGAGLLPRDVLVTQSVVEVRPTTTPGPGGEDPALRFAGADWMPTHSSLRSIVVPMLGQGTGLSWHREACREFAKRWPRTWLPVDYSADVRGKATVVEYDGRGWRVKEVKE